jgi:ketosteroid isomerase-like protein
MAASPRMTEEPVTSNVPPGDGIEVVKRFHQALNARDLEGMLACLTDDTVFENTHPAPDGTRYAGRGAVRAFWEEFLEGSTAPQIEAEEIFAAGDRCVMRWIYTWVDADGVAGRIRGVDLYRVRGGLIAEKLSYVKG